MSAPNQIRADFDARSIVVYQAYNDAIADAAIGANRFVPPFSTARMTWIKPSFLWLMHRSNWAQKSNQTRILKVRITRAGWNSALAKGVLTSFEPRAHGDFARWQSAFSGAEVHVQWDPERTLRGADAGTNSIQVGLSRAVIESFVSEWTLSIEDLTPLVRKVHTLLQTGHADKARRLLPAEKPYAVEANVARRISISG
jgi:hypothetical protein